MIDKTPFPWTLDQYQRYRVLGLFLETFFGETPVSVLDVGGLSPHHGSGETGWLPFRRIHRGAGRALDLPNHRDEDYIRGDGRRLPFRDGSFTVVSALDVIEHVPPADRETFLSEMLRVAASAVVISAPFRDPGIQAAEERLSRLLREAWGTDHRQLAEHRECGLPDIDRVNEFLRGRAGAAGGFGYGALETWFLLQIFKSRFPPGPSTAGIREPLEKWFSRLSPENDLRPPFARWFWLAGPDLDSRRLESGIARIKEELKQPPAFPDGLEDLFGLDEAIRRWKTRPAVAALVIGEGDRSRLKATLDHLRTQTFPGEIHISVLDLSADPEMENFLAAHAPGVRLLTLRAGESAAALLHRFSHERESRFLLLAAEGILLPPDTAARLLELHDQSGRPGPFAPRVVAGRRAYGVWRGRRLSPLRLPAGRINNLFWKGKTGKAAWIYSECLFFERRALWTRLPGGGPPRPRAFFHWRKTAGATAPVYAPDIVVYRGKGA